ncbi:thiol protease sen102 [Phtheirospermum japonicum]|uniref:Thiol protease sen102 n=1 Tax=Phtheirospermum japonicum TaxID=374723 RepID=A0A830BLR1_9LAMI|nr:thiol protease sen102 [Phtheirospermum japonicum]
MFIRSRRLLNLSEQELIDCNRRNQGCSGGDYEYAFDYISKYGITSLAKYPYTGKAGKCKYRSKSPRVYILGRQGVPRNNERALLIAVATRPVSVLIDATSIEFQLYKRGVFRGRCGRDLKHAVTIVGYGKTSNGIRYWLVKNSWGAGWGEGGYIRMLRGLSGPGKCGIAMNPWYPLKRRPRMNASSLDYNHIADL